MTDTDMQVTTVQPYEPGTQWRFSGKVGGYENIDELALYAEPNGAWITDDYVADEISARDLWTRWVDQCAGLAHQKWPNLYRPGEVLISWYVTTPQMTGIFEGAPYSLDPRNLPGEPYPMGHEDFLTHYTHPVHSVSGERLNWLRLPVLDRAWNATASDKGGFIQEATGWKPSPLQPTVDVRQLGAAAGLYVPPARR